MLSFFFWIQCLSESFYWEKNAVFPILTALFRRTSQAEDGFLMTLCFWEKGDFGCFWAPSLCQSMEKFCLLTVLEVLPGLILVLTLVPRSERGRKNGATSSLCYFCSWATSTPAWSSQNQELAVKPALILAQGNKILLEIRAENNTLATSPKLYTTLIMLTTFLMRGEKNIRVTYSLLENQEPGRR